MPLQSHNRPPLVTTARGVPWSQKPSHPKKASTANPVCGYLSPSPPVLTTATPVCGYLPPSPPGHTTATPVCGYLPPHRRQCPPPQPPVAIIPVFRIRCQRQTGFAVVGNEGGFSQNRYFISQKLSVFGDSCLIFRKILENGLDKCDIFPHPGRGALLPARVRAQSLFFHHI